LDYFTNVPTPTILRFLALSQKVVPLIDGGDSGNRARLMIEDLVGDVRGMPNRAIPERTRRRESALEHLTEAKRILCVSSHEVANQRRRSGSRDTSSPRTSGT
jgi:hypothetical protein